jgi:hypothetical protein
MERIRDINAVCNGCQGNLDAFGVFNCTLARPNAASVACAMAMSLKSYTERSTQNASSKTVFLTYAASSSKTTRAREPCASSSLTSSWGERIETPGVDLPTLRKLSPAAATHFL